MRIVGIYLAAGKSSRMGKNKLTLPTVKGSLGSLALRIALSSSLDKIYIVTNGDENWIPHDIKTNNRSTNIRCPFAFKGQGESIKCGMRRALLKNPDAIMILLADQPLITMEMIEKIIRHWKKNTTAQFMAPLHQQIIKPPVLFSPAMYPALLHLKGDTGAKSLLKNKRKDEGEFVQFTEDRLFFDIDTKDDYEKLIEDLM